MAKITPDMIIADVLKMDKGTVPIFLNSGMHCLGCPSASGESIKEACEVHGIDAGKLVEELNNYLEGKN
jgi:hybrid cluster-associated redox disulfide protein